MTTGRINQIALTGFEGRERSCSGQRLPSLLVRPGRCKTCLGSPSCGESVWLRPTDDDVFAISFVSSRVGRLVPRADLLGTSSTVFNFSYERSGIPPWPRPSTYGRARGRRAGAAGPFDLLSLRSLTGGRGFTVRATTWMPPHLELG